MKKKLEREITKKIGSIDAPSLVSKLEELGVTDNAWLYDRGINIPAALVSNIEKFQVELDTLSNVGRVFTVSIVDDRLQIDFSSFKSNSSNLFFQPSKELPVSLGIVEENVQLPSVPKGSKVLDIGAGTGLISKKIKDTFSADVYALEPSFERASDFKSCVDRLGEDHVDKLTLQEALERFPEKYFQAFDVVCVFKYNVPYKQNEDFIRALSQVVKPGGTVYVTSVEHQRFTFSKRDEKLFLTDIFQKYFGHASFETRTSIHGSDQLMTLSEPKLDLSNESSPESPRV